MAVATKEKNKKPAKGQAKIQPLGDRVLIEREASEHTTSGGIVLPDSAKNKPSRGTIVAVGDGKVLDDGKRHALQVKVGERVLFSQWAGNDIDLKYDDQDLLLLREEDILAVIDG